MRFRVRPLAVPFRRTIASPIYRFTHLYTILCEAEDGSGATGTGALWFPSEAQARVVLEALRYLAPTAAPHSDPAELVKAVRREMNFLGYKGVTVIAMSGFEMAIQDLHSRAAELSADGEPGRTTVPAYWSGFFLNESIEAWLAEAAMACELGFRAFKARVGRPTLAEDIHRVAQLRDRLPPDAVLMVDAHQSWDVASAIEAARRLQPYGITWLEDPLIHTDYHGLADVVEASPIPIAAGENEYLSEGFAQLLETGVRYLLADLERLGGIGEWWRVAALASDERAVLTPHLYPHVALRLCSRLTQDECWLEYVDWWDPLMAEEIQFVNGEAVVPNTAGTGFVADPDAVERYALATWEELDDARHREAG